MSKVENLIEDLRTVIAEFEADADKSLTNKAAATRMRKATSNMAKVGKELRAESVAHGKA